MEHRTRTVRVEPAQPEREVTVIGSYYTCDACGVRMPQYNATHWVEEGMVPRSRLLVWVDRESHSGEESENQRISRDYCDECFPGIWKAIVVLTAYKEAVGGDE